MTQNVQTTRRIDSPSVATVWLASLPFLFATGTLVFLYKYLDDLARQRPGTLPQRLLEEGTGWLAAVLVCPGVIWAARRFRFTAKSWWRVLPAHLAVAATLSVVHTSVMAVSRHFLFPFAGLGRYDYGEMRFRYPMEMAQFLLFYAMISGAIHLFDYVRDARERELAASELQARLAQAQLHNLQLQLQPHFLFNALNTISSVMYEDVSRADAMLAQLCDLLRTTLRQPDSQEIPLHQEIETLRLYLRIMQERFGDQLNFDISVAEEATDAAVPQLLLQPLVENSIRHGSPAAAPLMVHVRAARQDGNLVLQVTDNGPGISNAEEGGFQRGVGLSNTEERLAAMYGPEHEVHFENGRDGGLTVTVRLPFRTLAERSA